MNEHEQDDPQAGARTVFDAVRAGDLERLRAALDSGVDASACNEAGDTLLMLAAYHCHEALVALLLARGAHADALNGRGQHPLAGVCYKGCVGVARRLLDAGASAEGAPGAARSPLM